MKKRLRKKKKLGEFQALGFSFEGKTHPMDHDAGKVFLSRLFVFLDEHGFGCGGGADLKKGDFGFAIEGPYIFDPRGRGGRGWFRRTNPTEDDRQKVSAWLRSQPEVIAVRLSPLYDSYYGPEHTWECTELVMG